MGTYKTQYQVTFDQTGLDSTSTGTVVTVGAVTRSRTQLPYTNWFDSGTTYSYSDPASSSTTGKRFDLTSVTGQASPITSRGTVTGNYQIQSRLTVVSARDSPTPAVGDNWYNSGTSVTASVTSSDQSGGTRYGCTGWSGTGNVPSSGSGTSVTFTIDQASSITWNWIVTQYQVSARYSTSDGSTPSASVVLSGTQSGSPFTLTLTTSAQSAWLDAGTPWWVNNPIPASPTSERWNATSGTSGFVLSGTSINPTYYHQYQVTFAVSGSGTTSPSVGTNWQNAGSLSISATANSGYTFSSWGSNTPSITFANAGSSSTTATISGPGTITANFVVIYKIGNQNTGTNTQRLGDRLRGIPITATQSGTMQSISAYVNQGSGSDRHIKAALYTTSGTLVGSTTELTLAANSGAQWVTMPFSTKPSITSGNTYILVVWGESSSSLTIYYSSTATNAGYDRSYTYTTSWPTPPGLAQDTYYYCIYCSYTVP